MEHAAPDTSQTKAPDCDRRGCEASCLALALVGCATVGAAIGWGAAVVERFRAPVLVFPILTGLLVGLCSTGVVRVCRVPGRRTAVWGAILAVSVAVMAQHYASYDAAWRTADREEQLMERARQAFPSLAEKRLPAPPTSLLDYLQTQAEQGRVIFAGCVAKGPAAWLTWGVDAALVLAAAVVVAWRSTRERIVDGTRRVP